MTYKLVVADVVEVPVKFTLNDAGKTVSHFFHLTARRLSQDALQDLMKRSDTPLREFLAENVTGWRGQRLVVDEETGAPAAFSPAAFDCLLSLAGMQGIVYAAYLGAVVLADTAQGREKN